MNRRRKLLEYEWRNVRWIFLAGLILSAFLLICLYSILDATTESSVTFISYFWNEGATATFGTALLTTLSFATPVAILGFGVMAAIQFSDFHKRNKREFIVSLPYTQKERFVAKLIIGFSVIIFVWLVFSIGVFCMRNIFYNSIIRLYLVCPEYKLVLANDTWIHTLRSLFLMLLVLLLAYAIYMLLHSVVIHGVVASLMAIGVMLAPLWILRSIFLYGESFFGMLTNNEFSQWFQPTNILIKFALLFVGDGYYDSPFSLNSSGYYKDLDSYPNIVLISYGKMTGLFILVILCLFAVLAVTWFINMRQDGSKFGVLIPQKAARYILCGGISFCVSIGVTWLIARLLWIMEPIIVILLLLLVAAGLFVLLNCILKKITR